jgi:hypothetical protein
MSITILDSTAIDGTISITSIANATTNTNRFLVSDSGVVKYRTGAQLRSDIGAGTSSTVGTVTSIGGTGTVSGLTLSGTVTVSGNLTLAGSLVLTSANVTSGLGFTPYNATNPAGYTTNTGTVTSVGYSHAGNAFTVGGQPVTSAGTIAVTMAGTSAQYINGAGNLTTFPAIPQGDITAVVAGTGISGGGTSGSVTITNSDLGSSQFIFKNVASDSGTAVADNNNDTLSIVGAGSVTTAVVGDTLTITGSDDNDNFYVTGASYASGTLTLTRNGLTDLTATGFPTNNNQLTNGAGYTTNTGTTTASNTQTFTNKSGSNLQWTNDAGYVTSSGGSMSSWNIRGDSGTSAAVTDGQTVTIQGGANITTSSNGYIIDIVNDITNNNQLTNGAGYTTNTGTTTPSNTQTFTNKSGSNNQWTNDSGYITAASLQGVPAILSNGTVPSLNTGISAAEVRSLIGAGTSSLTIGTTASTAKAGDTTTITSTQASNITTNNAKVGITSTQASNITTNNAKVTDSGTPAILSNGTVPSLNSGISAAEVRSLIGAGTSSASGTVTSVDITTGAGAIQISGSPITTSGSIDLAFLGGAAEYINGAGDLATFPSIPTNNNQLTNGAGYTSNTGTTTASNSQTFTNKGGNVSQWTNDAGYLTSAPGGTIYTPDIWGIDPGNLYTANAQVVQCNNTQFFVGTSNTGPNGALPGALLINDVGMYEITYQAAAQVPGGVTTRQVPALYITESPPGGPESNIPGSLMANYLRLPGNNQGGFTSFSNTCYFNVTQQQTTIALKIHWLDGANRQVDIFDANSVPSTISIKRIT